MGYVWIFLLLFAVLAAAWFYLQRAKARPTTTVTTTETPADTSPDRPAS